MKIYKCKVCKNEYTKRNPWQVACSLDCVLEISKTNKTAVNRATKQASHADTKKRKDALKTRSDYVKEAQKAFNAYIRARDADKPCISCGTNLKAEAVGGGFDCGHYRSVGSAPHLRFDPDNAHGQCKKCNRYLSGNAVEYRRGLIERIGQQRLDLLEADQCVRKYAIEGLQAIISDYKAMKKELE